MIPVKRERELLDYLLTGIVDGLIISPSSETFTKGYKTILLTLMSKSQ